MKYQKGVTLIELMVTVSIVAIILTSVAPSIQSILIKNRIVAEINELSSLIQYARHQAIDEQTPIIICPSTDYKNCITDWNAPKIVFLDSDGNGKRDEATEELLVASSAIADSHVMTGPALTLQFEDTGEANMTTEILLCHKDKYAGYARSLSVTLQGRVKMSSDSDNNGVNENAAGIPLSC
ncbi:MAG: GspH/FimT family pseudopilin [Paraglaciecola sp.]|nr:GspH/FimT family pseudopilin [Paraglaciecola sp.]